MLWVFERDADQLRLETNYDEETAHFVLTIRRTGVESQVERFPDQAAFRRRLEALEQQLEGDHWTQTSVTTLRDGWKVG
jgi:hypothetical protein